MEEKYFDYEKYIQQHLKSIDNLDERKYAKELLVEGLEKIFYWSEKKYEALEQRIENEIPAPWKSFHVYTTVVSKEEYDPINQFWNPVCDEDIKGAGNPMCETIYLMADIETCREFLNQKMIVGLNKKTGESRRFSVEKAKRYESSIYHLHSLFVNNHIPWQTIHMGHLERFFDLIPEDGDEIGENEAFNWGEWDSLVGKNILPLWNIQRMMLRSREYRCPCLDEVVYEHIYHLGDNKINESGFLVENNEAIMSIRYEHNKVILRSSEESMEDVMILRLNQKLQNDSYQDRNTIFTNYKKNSLAARYLNQSGNFIQTPVELYRKFEELCGDYKISIKSYELTDTPEKHMIAGDMNELVNSQLFTGDNRKILLLKVSRNEKNEWNYLYESQLRYMLSQLQMEFLEYRCRGIFV